MHLWVKREGGMTKASYLILVVSSRLILTTAYLTLPYSGILHKLSQP